MAVPGSRGGSPDASGPVGGADHLDCAVEPVGQATPWAVSLVRFVCSVHMALIMRDNPA